MAFVHFILFNKAHYLKLLFDWNKLQGKPNEEKDGKWN